MADINSSTKKQKKSRKSPKTNARTAPPAKPAPKNRARQGSDENIGDDRQDGTVLEMVELLFFAYRDFVSDPDEILQNYNFGRAHHRVLHFVNRYPGLRVAGLLEILKITKQSLARVLKQLVEEGFIRQEEGKYDRRERKLYLTPRGEDLFTQLSAPQIARFENAFAAIQGHNPDDPTYDSTLAIRKFLTHLISHNERPYVQELQSSSPQRGKR